MRAHLKLADRNGIEIGTGFSSALWLGHPSDTFDLILNGHSGSVLVCRGGKTTKPRVLWKGTIKGIRLAKHTVDDGAMGMREVFRIVLLQPKSWA